MTSDEWFSRLLLISFVTRHSSLVISIDFQGLAVRNLRKGSVRLALIPVGDRGDIVLQRQVKTAIAFPAQGLNCDAQIFFKPDRIHDMPPVEPETVLGLINAVRTYYL